MARNALPRIALALFMSSGLVLACDQTPATPAKGANQAAPSPQAPAQAQAPTRPASRDHQSPLAEFREIGERLYAGSNRYLGRATLEALHAEIAPADLARRSRLHWLRGLVYLRQAEISNCVAAHHSDHCIFPLSEAAVHTFNQPARNAQASLRKALELRPGDLRARWLINIAGMAAGTHGEIPERFRIDPSAFDSEDTIPRFRDIAPDLGIDTFNLCGGVIVEDFDGDHRLDILTSSYDPLAPLTFYHNNGDMSFDDRSAQSHADE